MKRTQKFTSLFLSVVIVVMLVSSLSLGVALAGSEVTESQTRVFDANLDRMLDDVTGTDTTPAYRAISWQAGQCDDINDPIFKIASPKISAGFDTLEIEFRSVDGSVTLADLKLALRVADNDAIVAQNTYALNDAAIAGAIDGTIGTDWSTVSFDFTQSDIKVDGKAFDTTQPDALLGFHLLADATKAGKLDIRKIAVTKSGAETIVENFDTVATEWWKGTEGGCFVDNPRSYTITDSKEIKSTIETSNNVDEKYSAIVLAIAGNGNVSLAPIAEDGTVGTVVAWADLKDLEGASVVALDSNYRNVVISLESLGAKKIQGVKVIVTGGEVSVAKAFFTNMETVTPDKYFPTLDTASIAYLSQFNFNYVPGDNYEQAVSDCVPFNCDYILSYSAEKPVIANGHIVLTDKGNAFSSVKIRSKVASEGRQYLVIKYALQNGSTLNDFRFALVKTESDAATSVVYANQCQAGVLLPSMSGKNPYSDGAYSYLVVDIEKSFGLTESISGIDMYYSGAGEMLVDEIFYADSVKPVLDVENKHVFDAYEEVPASPKNYWWTDFSDASKLSVVDGALKIEVPASTSVCVGGAKSGNNKDFGCRYMVIRMKSENLDMSTFRIQWLDGATSYANAGGFKTLSGNEFALTDEYQDFVIDLDASGINREIEGFRLWLGGWNAEAGALYIDEIYFTDLAVAQEKTYSANTTVTAGEGYHYLCGGDFANVNGSRYLQISLTALNTFKFDELRFELQLNEGAPVLIWSNQGVLLANGKPFNVADAAVLGEGEEASDLTQTFVFDLDALGIDYANIKAIQAHMTNVNVDSSVEVGVKFFDYVIGLNSVSIPRNDDTNPVLDVTIDANGVKAGDEITINATATDNYGDVTVVYEVTVNGEAVEVVDGKFTATKAGNYTVKVTAIDGNDNKTVYTQNVTVAAAPQNDVPAENTGLDAGAIAGIVIGCLAVVAIIAVVVVFVSKKKKK